MMRVNDPDLRDSPVKRCGIYKCPAIRPMPTPSWTVSSITLIASNSPAKACVGPKQSNRGRLDPTPRPVTTIHRPARLATRAASFRYGGRHHSGIPGGIIPLYPGGFVEIGIHDLTRQNVAVKVQEDFKDLGGDTLDKLDVYIAHCDAVVHLVGDMCGAAADERHRKRCSPNIPIFGANCRRSAKRSKTAFAFPTPNGKPGLPHQVPNEHAESAGTRRFCAERVALTQGAVPAEFSEQVGYGGGIERGHIRDVKRDARRSMHLGNGPGKMLVALLSGVSTIWLAPKVRQRTVFAVDGILTRACGSRNCGKRLRAVV